MKVPVRLTSLVVSCLPACAAAAEVLPEATRSAGDVGVSGLCVLADICFAGMGAQNGPSAVWRIVAFLFGFPGTLVSHFVVAEGSERAWGVEVPRKR